MILVFPPLTQSIKATRELERSTGLLAVPTENLRTVELRAPKSHKQEARNAK